jgi:hypothetical protein
MAYAKTEAEWGAKASEHLKTKMKETGVTYDDLVQKLKKHGFKDQTRASITMKLKRGTFGAGFMLACLAALEADGIKLEDL